jgi:hypothetical protein
VESCKRKIDDDNKQPPQVRASKEAQRQVSKQKLAQIRGLKVPKNYQKLIDAGFIAILKDPDSRRIEYTSMPYGSFVCGTINARNSYGGYTGRQPFFAYFDAKGNIAELRIYSDKDLTRVTESSYLDQIPQAEYYILQDCGVLSRRGDEASRLDPVPPLPVPPFPAFPVE